MRVGSAFVSRLEDARRVWWRASVRRRLQESANSSSKVTSPFVVFVLGGPGSGKGTQCAKIVETFKFTHISAGDLLRREIASNSKNGMTISDLIKDGRIVPSEVTVKLLQDAINCSQNHKFLIDGFPRNNENRVAYENIIGIEPNFVLYFECPEDEMVKRVLARNQGRIDDNAETVKKRLEVFSDTMQIINYYSEKGKVHKIPSVGTVEEVFARVRPLFSSCN